MKRMHMQRRSFGVLLLVFVAFTAWFFWPNSAPKDAQAKVPSEALLDPVVNDPDGVAETVEMVAATDTPKVEIHFADEPKPLGAVKIDPKPPTLTMGATPAPTERTAERTPAPRPETAPQPTGSSANSDVLFDRADAALAQNRPVQARELLNRALHDAATSPVRKAEARRRLGELSDVLFFSDKVIPGDDISRVYKVAKGDLLSTISRKQGLKVEYGFIQRINGITDPKKLRLNQQIKVVQGPFHAIISKNMFRLDLYASERDAAGNRLFIRSFDVGLGEFGSTPTGAWKVANSKVVDPGWTNPRTYKTYAKGDPKNPIGTRWIGLKGDDVNTKDLPSYGIHGTIHPGSIGTEASMGCIRLREGEIEVLYELLMPGVSEVLIVD